VDEPGTALILVPVWVPLDVLADLDQRDEDGLVWTTRHDLVRRQRLVAGAVVVAGRGDVRWLAAVVDVPPDTGAEAVRLQPLIASHRNGPSATPPVDAADEPSPGRQDSAAQRRETQLRLALLELRQIAHMAVRRVTADVLVGRETDAFTSPQWRALAVASDVPEARATGRCPPDELARDLQVLRPAPPPAH
jgi:hypothetical protein